MLCGTIWGFGSLYIDGIIQLHGSLLVHNYVKRLGQPQGRCFIAVKEATADGVFLWLNVQRRMADDGRLFPERVFDHACQAGWKTHVSQRLAITWILPFRYML